MTCKEIAKRIGAHLMRFECDPKINHLNPRSKTRRFYMSGASGTTKVKITYVSYQGPCPVKKDKALRYLAWLDAGNVGEHYAMGKDG